MKNTVGSFEKVSFPALGIHGVIAKIDTGALTGSLHAKDIAVIKLATGERALRFTPIGQTNPVKLTSFKQKQVRSSNGTLETRYVIATTLELKGVHYPINISLADRSKMMKGVLIGRRFLRRHGFLVDPKKGSKYRYEVKED